MENNQIFNNIVKFNQELSNSISEKLVKLHKEDRVRFIEKNAKEHYNKEKDVIQKSVYIKPLLSFMVSLVLFSLLVFFSFENIDSIKELIGDGLSASYFLLLLFLGILGFILNIIMLLKSIAVYHYYNTELINSESKEFEKLTKMMKSKKIEKLFKIDNAILDLFIFFENGVIFYTQELSLDELTLNKEQLDLLSKIISKEEMIKLFDNENNTISYRKALNVTINSEIKLNAKLAADNFYN